MSVAAIGKFTTIGLPPRLGLWRFLAGASAVLGVLALADLWDATVDLFGAAAVTTNWMLLCGAFLAGTLLSLGLLGASFLPRAVAWLESRRLPDRLGRGWRVLAGVIASLSFVPLIGLTLHPYYGEIFLGRVWLKLDVLWWQALVLAACLRMLGREIILVGAVAMAVVLQAVVYRCAVYLPAISTYPFSLDYSEASRYYYASLFLGKAVYGHATALPVLHPTLHVLLAAPFLIPGSP